MSGERKPKPALAKRKTKLGPSASRKRLKVQYTSVDGLPWKAVNRPSDTGLDGDDGILDLEEVEDVEVVYEDTEGGRVMKFNVLERSNKTTKIKEDAAQHEADEVPSSAGTEVLAPSVSFDSESLLPNWHSFGLHSHLFQVLHSKGFTTPTPIQAQALPIALGGRDVVGVAETGSGKTLAYGLPILHHIISHPRPPRTKRKLQALVLAPTRELALQVSDHLNIFARIIDVNKEAQDVDIRNTNGKEKQPETKTQNAPPLVSIAAVVGGMSAQKQRRILDRGVDVLVATPGRLWDILGEDEPLAKQISQLRFLVLDEADRMVEAGHFAEMDNILRLTIRKSQEDEIEPSESQGDSLDQVPEKAVAASVDTLQTFVFSATLSKDLQKNLKRLQKSYRKKHSKPASTLDDLLLRLDFRDPDPAVIDISPEGGAVSTLEESRIECLSTDKDAYLYYFLLRYPGRSLVFLSSIDGIRRLAPLTELLNLKAFPLHSQMEQRQRLKNLDRFKATPNAVLLATDIAARGLDIPAVDHVVHYQIPRSADVFVHRNGRTARAMRKGFSLLMCAPDERRVVRALLASLGRKDTDIPEISVELTLLDKLKNRILLARQIDSQQHKIRKQHHEKNWLKETAEAMEIELDSDILSESEDESHPSKQRKKKNDAKIAVLKAQLKELVSQPLLSRGVSTRYITSGSRPIADDIISGKVHETMLGLKKSEPGDDLVTVTKPKLVNKKEHEEPEEWHGFDS